jgi:hypothetical protein
MKYDTLATIVLSCCLFAFGVLIGAGSGRDLIKRDAINAGVAEYYLPSKIYSVAEFRWKTNSVVITNTVFTVSTNN